jgi:hypothetical protein
MAATEVNRDIAYGETAEGTVIVWLLEMTERRIRRNTVPA